MGGVYSYVIGWVYPGETYDLIPDPVTGLTEKDCKLIMGTWALVSDRKSIKKNGIAFFIELFKAHPYTQDLFVKLKGRPLDDLWTCPIMGAHATTVMYALKAYVDNVDDSAALAGLVTRISYSHVERNITTEDMDKLSVVFLKFMKAGLGDHWTEDAEAAWTQLLKVHNIVYKQIEDTVKNKK